MGAMVQRLRKEAVTVILALLGMAIQLPTMIQDWSAAAPRYLTVGGCTVVLFLLALVFLLWRRDTEVSWSWEEPLLFKVLNRRKRQFTPCRRHFTARSQGRALGCAVGPNLVSAIKHMLGETGSKGLELLVESDFDVFHVALHLVNAGGIYHGVSVINSSAWIEHLKIMSQHETDDDATIHERAKDLLRDLQRLQDDVKREACEPLEKLLAGAAAGQASAADIKKAFQDVGEFLAGRGQKWLTDVYENAHNLGELLRMHWERNYALRREHCLCVPQNDS